MFHARKWIHLNQHTSLLILDELDESRKRKGRKLYKISKSRSSNRISFAIIRDATWNHREIPSLSSFPFLRQSHFHPRQSSPILSSFGIGKWRIRLRIALFVQAGEVTRLTSGNLEGRRKKKKKKRVEKCDWPRLAGTLNTGMIIKSRGVTSTSDRVNFFRSKIKW